MRCPKRRHRGFLEFDMQEESNSFAKTPKKAVNRQSIKDINTFCIDEFYFCTNQKLDENLLSNQLQSVNVSKFHKIRKTTLCENVLKTRSKSGMPTRQKIVSKRKWVVLGVSVKIKYNMVKKKKFLWNLSKVSVLSIIKTKYKLEIALYISLFV